MRGLLLQIALTFAALSLVSIGGANALLPELHRQVVDVLGWMDNTTFVSMLAISQAVPGPNILLVSLIGLHVGGMAGLLVATVAIMVPSSLLAFAAGRVASRWANTSWMRVIKAGLIPVAVGLILASGVVTAHAADHTLLAYTITTATAAFVILSDRNPLWAIATGTILCILSSGIGLPL